MFEITEMNHLWIGMSISATTFVPTNPHFGAHVAVFFLKITPSVNNMSELIQISSMVLMMYFLTKSPDIAF